MKHSSIRKITAALLLSLALVNTAACTNTAQTPASSDESSTQSSAESSEVSEKTESKESQTVSKTESSKSAEKSEASKTESSKTEISKTESSKTQSSEASTESTVSESENTNPSEETQVSEELTPESSVIKPQDPPVTEPFFIQKPQESNTVTSSEPEVVSSEPQEQPEPVDYAEVPEEWQDNGIFSRNYARAYSMVRKMSLEEKVGQMILAGCPASDGPSLAKQYHLGGYLLFGRDFGYTKTKDEITAAIRSYNNGLNIPLIIGVDEEGGTVSRLRGNYNLIPHDFLSPRALYAQGGLNAIKDDAKEKADILSSLLINTNLAPVCDISKNPNDFMYSRSIGQNPDITSDFVKAVTQISQQNGVSVALKHFPGYGNNVDTHTGVAIDKRNYATFEANDFLPFKAGIDAGAHMVLVSHNIVECMDANYPASLSPEVHRILRQELGFTGVVITDDLSMDAISVYIKGYSPVVAAVIAGNDMLCVSDIPGTYNDVINAVHKGNIEEKQIDHAVMRILSWKMSKNML